MVKCDASFVVKFERDTVDDSVLKFLIKSPATDYPDSQTSAPRTEFLLNKPLQSPCLACTHSRLSITRVFKMIRGQTLEDYRPNEILVPSVLKKPCSGYLPLISC
ncbi:hypothetical protein PHMEG_00025496 [Phytophthora megakarya]|uniref:Uncharacterized protein n=1 Tax=Phytophthora megakarya TaxID=4795 RepID=A0A225VEG5_9STRA|nr:hypothetical protein PHMEG_00025496 [Phytophthora megakarya]